MKTRIISALVGLAVLAVVIINFGTMFFNAAVAIVLVIAADEILGAFKLKGNLPLMAVSFLFAAALPFINITSCKGAIPAVIFIYVFLVLLIMLHEHQKLEIVSVAAASAILIAAAVSGTSLIYMRDLYGKSVGLYAIVIILTGAWMSDTGAYFSGVFFGKHKMAPLISPKKTIEGAVGGVIVCTISEILFSYIYVLILSQLGMTASIEYLHLAVIAPFISLVSIVGDLSASIIKRQTGIKDFGKIMPGHGGILDRFDSVLMVIPVVYFIFSYHPLITIL